MHIYTQLLYYTWPIPNPPFSILKLMLNKILGIQHSTRTMINGEKRFIIYVVHMHKCILVKCMRWFETKQILHSFYSPDTIQPTVSLNIGFNVGFFTALHFHFSQLKQIFIFYYTNYCNKASIFGNKSNFPFTNANQNVYTHTMIAKQNHYKLPAISN